MTLTIETSIIKTSDIVFRKDLYPRFEHKQSLIEQYSQSLEYLPPIKVSPQNILIDGYHRWKAHELAGQTEIKADVLEVASEKELKKLAYQYNSVHGLQLTSEEKQAFANEMIGESTVGELANILSVSESIVTKWTKSKRETLDAQRDQKVLEEYLRAWNSQASIGSAFGLSQKTVSDIVSKKSKIPLFTNGFEPYVYNIWNLQKQDNSMPSRFGSFPNVFMQNLLHFHTQVMDVVYDPMAGGGTTVDICKKMLRRYYCTDRQVTPGREADIRKATLEDGIPTDLPKPDLVFLDPPYSIIAKGEYAESEDKGDLGNVPVEVFYETFHKFVSVLADWKVRQIAYLIRPFWITNNGAPWKWSDPMFEMYYLLRSKGYQVKERYVLPYSSQQYSGLWVDRAKTQNKALILNRELTIFEVG